MSKANISIISRREILMEYGPSMRDPVCQESFEPAEGDQQRIFLQIVDRGNTNNKRVARTNAFPAGAVSVNKKAKRPSEMAFNIGFNNPDGHELF